MPTAAPFRLMCRYRGREGMSPVARGIRIPVWIKGYVAFSRQPFVVEGGNDQGCITIVHKFDQRSRGNSGVIAKKPFSAESDTLLNP